MNHLTKEEFEVNFSNFWKYKFKNMDIFDIIKCEMVYPTFKKYMLSDVFPYLVYLLLQLRSQQFMNDNNNVINSIGNWHITFDIDNVYFNQESKSIILNKIMNNYHDFGKIIHNMIPKNNSFYLELSLKYFRYDPSVNVIEFTITIKNDVKYLDIGKFHISL
jgi:hypothetical protein